MEEKSKYDIIHDIIALINEISEARGVDRCVKIIGSVQALGQLERKLREEDESNEAVIKKLSDQIDSERKE